jgi:hypothetical protein
LANAGFEDLRGQLAQMYHYPSPAAATAPLEVHAQWSASQPVDCGAEAVLCLTRVFDDAPVWDYPKIVEYLHGVPSALLSRQPIEPAPAVLQEALEPLLDSIFAREACMSTKRLESATRASAYQKVWFAGLQDSVGGGAPLALVNADTPPEILRSMDIPYVVNQWWASVVSAKRLADRSLDALRRRVSPTTPGSTTPYPSARPSCPPKMRPGVACPSPIW